MTLAWQGGHIGLSKINAYFGIDIEIPNINTIDIIKRGMRKMKIFLLIIPLGLWDQRD